jgi:signal transduction histidine kinase
MLFIKENCIMIYYCFIYRFRVIDYSESFFNDYYSYIIITALLYCLPICDGIAHRNDERTEILYDMESAISYGVRFIENAKERMDIFVAKNGPSVILKNGLYNDNYVKARNRGAKIRFITEITKGNVHYCKELRKIVDEIRHLDVLKGSICVTESEFLGSTAWREKQLLSPLIYSNEKAVVEQQQYIFDTFWERAKPYAQRVIEIEEGIETEVIETSSNPTYTQKKVFDLLNSVNKEILILFSTSNAVHRQIRAGSFQKLKQIEEDIPWVSIRILTPKDHRIEKIFAGLTSSNFSVRFIETLSRVSILIVDRKYSLVAELKDDTKQTVEEAIGLATYSNSKSTVLSYSSIFESLWKQTEMYEQLQIHDKIQKEFINTAAHELRTPIQPILGITNILKGSVKDDKHKELLNVIGRNAQRLKKLSEDILEVSKIESNSMGLDKEHFRIVEIILDNVNNYKNNTDGKSINFEYALDDNDDLTVYGDKDGISQVISNLISNSIKFISFKKQEGGVITILAKRKRIVKENEGVKETVVVSIKDTGTGIDKEIFPRLFTKFTTKSFHGIGLGLYISKNIVEAHGGSIWAENNRDGQGATFNIALPLKKT